MSGINEKTERLNCEIVKAQIDLLNRFYIVIGDSYNPTEISMKYSLNKRIKPEEIFIYESINNIGTKWFYEESILPTKEIIQNPVGRLIELMEWNRNHVIGFDGCRQIVQQEFRSLEFKEIYDVIIKQVQLILSKWEITSEQYLLDIEREGFLSLLGNQKTLDRIQYMLMNNKPLRN